MTPPVDLRGLERDRGRLRCSACGRWFRELVVPAGQTIPRCASCAAAAVVRPAWRQLGLALGEAAGGG